MSAGIDGAVEWFLKYLTSLALFFASHVIDGPHDEFAPNTVTRSFVYDWWEKTQNAESTSSDEDKSYAASLHEGVLWSYSTFLAPL